MGAFGQLVIGPPGSGKTTYCALMQQLMAKMGRRVVVVNLDPANDALPYTAAVDVSDLVTLNAVMDEFGLGPNGGLIYCMEYLEKNLDWLKEKLEPLEKGASHAHGLGEQPSYCNQLQLQTVCSCERHQARKALHTQHSRWPCLRRGLLLPV